MLRKLALLMLVACSNKGSASRPDNRTCEALAITSATSKTLLDLATQQYVSAEHAMQKWEQWRKKAVTPDQDGTGEFSGAGDRANRYRAAGDALCQSASLNFWQMRELATALTKESPSTELWRLNDFNCVTVKSPISPDAEVRSAFASDWQRRKGNAQEGATRAVEECFAKRGGTKPQVVLPPITLPTE